MNIKAKQGIFSIAVMNLGFLGINFGWGLEFANMSSIYQHLGASPSQIPILWLAAPLTGLIVQPFVGKWSDRTTCKIGKRKPYLLGGAIVAFIGLVLMPFCTAIWMAALLLWILDASVNTSMGPYRAYMADTLPEEQLTLGYSIQTVVMSIGTVIASCMPWFLFHVCGVTGLSSSGDVSSAVKISFITGGFVFLITIIITVIFGKEYPPENITVPASEKKSPGIFKSLKNDLMSMPKVMKQLAWVQFFSWMGYFCMVMYFPITVSNNIFNAVTGTQRYTEGIAWAGLCFSILAVFCLLFSFLIPLICKFISRKALFMITLLCGGIGLIGVYYCNTKYDLIWCMIGVGITYAGIMTLPYTILGDCIPKDKMGVYMGVFNLFICLPQIILALFFGFVMYYVFDNQREFGVVTGGVFLIIAAFLVLKVQDKIKAVKNHVT
ncbi:MAG: SLC45 family MFS transporter [bacterium]|nr:SLC45 family MFS transporter [bacterium]